MFDLISDGYGGEVNYLSQLDGRRPTAHHWHVMSEHTKAAGKDDLFLHPSERKFAT